jgi:hypothetical protein
MQRTDLLGEHIPLELGQVLHRPHIVLPLFRATVPLASPGQADVANAASVEQLGRVPCNLLVEELDPSFDKTVRTVLCRA